LEFSKHIFLYQAIFEQRSSFHYRNPNQNQDQMSCYIENQNIIHQAPFHPSYALEEPPVINLSFDPIMAYQMPILPPAQSNFPYNYNVHQNMFPNQSQINNMPFYNNIPNNGYYNYPIQVNDPSFFVPQMMYPQEMIQMNNFFPEYQNLNGQIYQGNNFMNSLENNSSHTPVIINNNLYNYENEPQIKNVEKQFENRYPYEKITKNNFTKNQNNNQEQLEENYSRNTKINEKINSNLALEISKKNSPKDIFPKKSAKNEDQNKSPNLSINDEFGDQKKNCPLEPIKKNNLIDIFAKNHEIINSNKNLVQDCEKSNNQTRKKWGQEKEQLTQKEKNKALDLKKQETIALNFNEDQQKKPVKSINFEINFDDETSAPLSEIFKNRKNKLLRKMEEQKFEKKEDKKEKTVVNIRSKEEILRQRKEMMKKPDFIQSKVISTAGEQQIPAKKQFYIETIEMKNQKKIKDPPSHIMERLALGIKPKVNSNIYYLKLRFFGRSQKKKCIH